MKSRLVHLAAGLLLIAGATLAWAHVQSPYGPIPSMTGAPEIGVRPAELECTLCHDGTLNPPGGQVEIVGVPSEYVPGAIYPLRVRLTSELTAAHPNRRWGFQITAVRTSDGDGAGTFIVPDPDTLQIVSGFDDFAARSYVTHRIAGNRLGLGGAVEWTFSWQAPAVSSDSVRFYCVGNVANGAFDTLGDFVFTTSDSAWPAPPAAVDTRRASSMWLAAPRPNPSRGPVEFAFSLSREGVVDLTMLDVLGREVRQLLAGRHAAGSGRASWDGRGGDGATVPPGTYFARMRFVDEPVVVRRVIIAR